MCGLAGLLGEPDAEAALAMSGAIAHRGPDGAGLHRDGPCVLVHRRLAIIDLSPAASQPMLNEDGSVAIAVVGEIYNHHELRRDLEARGHRFRSRSDIEVVAHLWEEHGAELVPMLRGMFALAVWDRRRRRLLLARDRYGEKALYWTMTRRGLAFGSELSALLALPEVGTRIDRSALDAYLALQYVPHPQTMFEGVFKLPPGHLAVVRPGETPSPRAYFTIDHSPRDLSEQDAVAEVRSAVEDAVRVRMMSDVPLGAFLSGGIDSSIVVACMARLSSSPVKTFSIGVGTDHELPYARLVAARWNTEHHEEQVRPNAVELLPAIVRGHGEPFADPSAIPTRVLAEMTKRHVTVALSGDAGDEAFGGYRRYVWAHVAHAIRRLPVGGLAAAVLRAVPGGRARWVREYGRHLAFDEARRYLRFVCHFSAAEKRALYTADLQRELAHDATAERFAHILAQSRGDALGRLMELDVRTYLPDDILTKVDIASMQHALEVRAPLVDPRVMELAASLPAHFKVRGLTGKVLLKRAFADLVPAAVVRRAKRGFSLPLAQWFARELHDFARDVLLARPARERGLFVPAAVEALLDAHRRGEDHGDRIWNLIVLELWFREVFDRRSHAREQEHQHQHEHRVDHAQAQHHRAADGVRGAGIAGGAVEGSSDGAALRERRA